MISDIRLIRNKTPLKIDISTGDIITPREIKYNFNLMLENRLPANGLDYIQFLLLWCISKALCPLNHEKTMQFAGRRFSSVYSKKGFT